MAAQVSDENAKSMAHAVWDIESSRCLWLSRDTLSWISSGPKHFRVAWFGMFGF